MSGDDAVVKYYAEHGIGASSGFGTHAAIVVVDVSRAFTTSEYGVGTANPPAVPHIAALLEEGRAVRVPIVLTSIAYEAEAEDGGYFTAEVPALRELRTNDPAATDVAAELKRQTHELVLVKKFPLCLLWHAPGFLSDSTPRRYRDHHRVLHVGLRSSHRSRRGVIRLPCRPSRRVCLRPCRISPRREHARYAIEVRGRHARGGRPAIPAFHGLN